MYLNLHTHHHSKETQNAVFSVENIVYTASTPLPYPTENIAFSVGVHPWHLENNVNWDDFIAFAQSKNVIAIGECGLDKTVATPLETQIQIFIQQIKKK